MKSPLVSCILLTADRPNFISTAIKGVLRQTYENLEVIVIDDGEISCSRLIPDHSKIRYIYRTRMGTIGTKRNIGCDVAKGKYLVHIDDDDWYSTNWVECIVQHLMQHELDLSGLNHVNFYSTVRMLGMTYLDDEKDVPWLCGATLAFTKSLWLKYNFANLQIGEDMDFVTNCGGQLAPFNYTRGFVGRLHERNTSIRHIEKINTLRWITPL